MATLNDVKAPTAPRPVIRMVLLGQRISADHKTLLYTFNELSNTNEFIIGKERTFSATKALRTNFPGAPGTIYTVEGVDTSIYPATARVAGRYEDRGAVLAWEQETRSAKTLLAVAKERKATNAESAISPLKATLKPLRAAYNRLSYVQREQFIARIIYYLTMGD